jgi:hypothetical protein
MPITTEAHAVVYESTAPPHEKMLLIDGDRVLMLTPELMAKISRPSRMFYTKREAAGMLGICVRTLERWESSGKIKIRHFLLPGASRGADRVPHTEIERLLNERRK